MRYASFKSRIVAFLLDYLVIVLYGIFVVGTISLVFGPWVSPLFSKSPVIAQFAGFLMITLPVSFYFIWCECSTGQGTWGKRKMGIRVVDDTGQRIRVFRATIRTVIKFLPWEVAHFGVWHFILPSSLEQSTVLVILITVNVIALLYLVFPLTNKRRKNIYDWVAGTVVIR